MPSIHFAWSLSSLEEYPNKYLLDLKCTRPLPSALKHILSIEFFFVGTPGLLEKWPQEVNKKRNIILPRREYASGLIPVAPLKLPFFPTLACNVLKPPPNIFWPYHAY